MAGNLTEARNWLKNKHIVVPDDWLEACLNWVMEENRNERLSSNKIKECVYEQWLIADLREIGSSSLPPTIFSDQKTTLQGVYSLQMLDILDVSQPAYGQLLKLRGKDSQNARVSAEPQLSAQPWESHPSRMLMMTLTDGVKSLKGMEYKPIPALHFGLPPGIKLQISGPVDCRLGILLLNAENIQILGGEVESLILENNKERILLRNLGQDDTVVENRHSHRREVSQSFDSGIAISESYGDAQHVENSMNAINSSHQYSAQQQQISINSSLSRRSSHHRETPDLRTNTIDLTESLPDSTCEDVGHDEFEDDDDDEFLTNLDYDHLDQLVQECSGSSSGRNKSETVKDSSSCKIRTPPPMLSDIPDWDLDDFA